MKRSLLLIFLLYFTLSFSTMAQITITSADLPNIGTMVINAVDTITPISPGNAGTNQVWDFSNLIASRYDTITYLSPEGIPEFEKFPQANIVYDYTNAGSCEGCSIAYSYLFFNQNDNNVSLDGIETQWQFPGDLILNIHADCADGLIMNDLPMNYGNSSTHNSVTKVYLGTWYEGVRVDTSMTESNENYTLTVDASGTLITPYNTFQVQRVKDDHTSVSTEYIMTSDGWEVSYEDTDHSITYTWYTNNYFVIGSCDGDERGTGFTFFKSSTVVSAESKHMTEKINVYPNPAGNQLTIQTDKQVEHATIYVLNGQEILTVRSSPMLDVSQLNPGMYLLRIVTSQGVDFTKFIKQ